MPRCRRGASRALAHSLLAPTPLASGPQVRRLVLDLLDGDSAKADALFAGAGVGSADWVRSSGAPVRELATEGFFGMCYPTVFVAGSGDPTVPRLRKVDFSVAVSHLVFAADGRLGAVLKIHLTNLLMRLKASQQAGYCVSQQLAEAHRTVPELVQALEAGDESVPRKILSIGANLKNSIQRLRRLRIQPREN